MVAFAVIVVPPAAAETAAPAKVDVTVEDGVLSVDLRNARFEDVLRAIAERTGIRFRLTGDLESSVTAWLALPVAEGIRQLVGDNGLIMISVYGAPDGRVVMIEPAVRTSSLDRVHGGFDRVDPMNKLRAVGEPYGVDDKTTVEDLALVLARETDQKVRKLAVFGPGESRGAKALAALLSPALEDKDRAIRIQAIHGVSKIGGHMSAEVRDHYFARPSIRRAVAPQRQPELSKQPNNLKSWSDLNSEDWAPPIFIDRD